MLKNFKPVSLILFAGALCLPKAYAETAPVRPEVNLSQQSGKVTGTVEDEFGPVAGASVVVKGTTNGNITDMDGNFTLEGVKNGDVIQISFIGYATQEIQYTGQASLQIKLAEDTQKLDEVVVTALGLKRQEKALGYAVTELKGEELNTNAINPVAALQGKVAGVEIAGSDGGLFGGTKIQIRGASTFGDNNQPIYVVDGVILDNSTSGNTTVDWGQGGNDSGDYGNELKNLNPDDFESVSVLKGAAATALYGSRGLNGAVVITTKSGKGASGFGVSFSQTFGIDHAFKTPDIQTEYGPGVYPGRADTDANGSIWDPHQFTVTGGQRTLIGASTTGFGPRYDGSEIQNYDGTMTRYSPIKNNMLDMYQLGFNSNTNVSVRGGSEKTTFYSSLSYKKANSTTPNNTFERYSLLAKATHKISDRVDVAAAVSFTNSKPRNAQRNMGEFFVDGNTSVLTPLYDPNYFRDKYLGDNHGGVATSDNADKYANVPQRGYWFKIDNYDYLRKETVVRPQIEINVGILDWLKFKADANMNYYYTRIEDKQLGDRYMNEGGYYAMTQDSKEQFTIGSTFTASKQINDFSVGGFARFEYYNNFQSHYKIYTDGGLVVPGQYFVDNSKNPKKSEGEIQNQKRIISAIFAANLGWKNQLFMDITGRNDWSSALVYANRTGNYSYFYPSVSGSWLISETFRDQLPSWINLAKVRASWAQVGNDTSPYTVNQAYSFETMEMYDGNIYVNKLDMLMKMADLKPERKNAWEIGLDFRALDSRIHLDATYYKENTKNQIIQIPVPSISGVSNQLVNAGNIQNQGIELALNTIPYKNKDWEWGLDLTWTKNMSKVVELHPNVGEYYALGGRGEHITSYDYHIGAVAKVGSAYGVLMSDLMPAVNENGEYLLTWNDSRRGAYQAQSKKVQEVGNMMPDFLGSLATSIKWKDLSLRVALDMRVGGMVASYCNLYGSNSGWTKSSLQYRDAAHGGVTWTSQYAESKGITYEDGVIPQGVFQEGTIATLVDGTKKDISGMSYAQLVKDGLLEPTHAGLHYSGTYGWSTHVVNDTWVHELSYIALREITLAYNLPKTIASKVGAKNLNFSFSARNLGYLYNSLPNNLNPETVRSNNASAFIIRGFEPYTANYMFTINASF